MKRYYLLTLLLVLLHFFSEAQTDTISQRIVLIGDAGQLTNGRHPVVDAVKKNIKLDDKTTIVFLGDNLYKSGLPDEQYRTYSQAKAVLDSQILIAKGTDAKVYMIPGNHDWENGGRGGYNAILRQQLYVQFSGINNVFYEPEDGCPGPVAVDIGPDVLLLMFDSQWWLHPHDKPEMESDCKCKTTDELVERIDDIISRNSKKLVLLACHHPFKSNGVHGGYFTLKQHLFPFTDLKTLRNFYLPLPVIGSAYPIARSVFGTPQDISHPNYTNMINEITAAVKRTSPNVIFVSGHDHNLQLIQDDNYNYIVSGGGCKQNRTSNRRNSLFNSPYNGFAVMEVSSKKNVQVTFYEVMDTIRKSQPFSVLNFSKLPVTFTDSSVKVTVEPTEYPDSVSSAVSKSMGEVKGLRKFFMGQNYRKEWTAPVSMKIFNLRRERGGFKIEGLGGGKQTRSLRLLDKEGNEWVLRNLNKNPVQTIPEQFRGPMTNDLVKELKSSSFPFGAFIVPHLAEPLSIPVAKPELFFVPDDPALEFYRPLFSNTVCLLERRNASVDSSKTQSTATVFFKKMLDDNDHRAMQPEVLRARLLDIVIADYDRHFDQWRWGNIDTGKGKLYYPVPRDRDQAFFSSDGKLLRFLSGRAMPFLKGLRPDIPKVEWLNYVARDFDRIFLTDLDQQEWEETVTEVQQKLTDSVIRNAVNQLPPEIFKTTGENIIRKLISRRNALKDAAMKYYRFISKQVNIIGSNQKEYFRVSNVGDRLQVRVFAKSRKGDTSFLMYSRIFDPAVTKEIRLFGLYDEDVFEVDKNTSTPIKIRIIGGRGIDTFNIKGKTETLLYDMKGPGGGDYYLKDSSNAKKRFSADVPVNDRSILGFNYNTSRFPQLHFNYNSDDGMMVGAGFSRRTHGFRNLPYATDQKLSALYAIDRGALRLQYRGEFNHITRNLDLVLKGDFTSPALQNFFGYGNNAVINPSVARRYYQTLYRYFEAEILLRRRFFDKLHFMAGPYFYHYNASFRRNIDNVLGKPQQVRLDSANVFSKKNYAGIKMTLQVDNRNKDFFPTRGIFWKNELLGTTRLNADGKYVAFTSDMSIYASLREPAKLVAILKFGGGKILSKNYEYFQAMSIGANNDLPGFRKHRYTGKSSMYGGLELRMQLFNVDSYILPGPIGLAAFYNAGRVWQPNDFTGSGKWHGAYGFGFYYLPFNMFCVSAYAGFSGKEKMLNFTLGTRINLTY